jgi:hypothetical protein
MTPPVADKARIGQKNKIMKCGIATVRHRTVRTKGALSAKTAKLMVFKLVNAAAKTWRRLNGENQLPKVVQGVKFQNGIEVTEMPAHHAA